MPKTPRTTREPPALRHLANDASTHHLDAETAVQISRKMWGNKGDGTHITHYEKYTMFLRECQVPYIIHKLNKLAKGHIPCFSHL